MWDHINPSHLGHTEQAAGEFKTGSRVAQHGTVSFIRSGFARVRWDDGRVSDEWAPELRHAPEETT